MNGHPNHASHGRTVMRQSRRLSASSSALPSAAAVRQPAGAGFLRCLEGAFSLRAWFRRPFPIELSQSDHALIAAELWAGREG